MDATVVRPASHRTRLIALAFCAFCCAGPLAAQDALLRAVALTEAVAPVGVLLVQGVDDPFEAGMLGGALLLHTVPNIVLLLAEAGSSADLTTIARWTSASAGFATAAASAGFGIALLAGAFPDHALEPYAGSFIAISLPALFAGFIDLIPYAIELPASPPTAR